MYTSKNYYCFFYKNVIYYSRKEEKEETRMKLYYKLTVSANIPHKVKVSFVNAFQLMEVSCGRKWISFYGASSDIETAYDLLKDEGFTVKKTWMRG